MRKVITMRNRRNKMKYAVNGSVISIRVGKDRRRQRYHRDKKRKKPPHVSYPRTSSKPTSTNN
jgi:hypothetical protein